MLTSDEVAKRCRVNRRTVYNWAERGDLEGYKLGGVWRFEQRTVSQFIKAGKRCRSTNVETSGGSDFNGMESPSADPLDQALNEWRKTTNNA